MAAKSAEAQARDFLYELTNCASEYGFAKDELWNVSIVADKQKAVIEKKYYPVISALLAPDVLATVPGLVATRLNQVIAGAEQGVLKAGPKAEPQYLVAYVATRKM
ncbi:hypothetical protein [Mucilaginibacter sp. OK283]|jgi:hypothetical protein|uniref:hypothetical protein n=1 Tax=Mucilaginibacter sp. OK283 TaxID=1881049 RepID=UPI0008AF4AD7|nr:hypothetical protein [Mucilaginibacter sp. OK283]SEO68171.1 hypothetical protein SAMN05428947_103389 [Mucilaginibacter sp. OK283]